MKNKKKEQKKSGKRTKNKQLDEIKKFKEKYFDYYDDIKHYTRGKEDW